MRVLKVASFQVFEFSSLRAARFLSVQVLFSSNCIDICRKRPARSACVVRGAELASPDGMSLQPREPAGQSHVRCQDRKKSGRAMFSVGKPISRALKLPNHACRVNFSGLYRANL